MTSVYRHNAQNRGDISTGRRSWDQQEQRLSNSVKLSDFHSPWPNLDERLKGEV